MKKTELVEVVASKCELTKKDAERVVDVLFEEVERGLLAGEEVRISGLGVLAVKERKERVGTTPGTGEKITIPAQRTVTFKTSKVLKEKLN